MLQLAVKYFPRKGWDRSLKWEDKESVLVTAVGLVENKIKVYRYTQKEKTFIAKEKALKDFGVVLSLPRFGKQDGSINK